MKDKRSFGYEMADPTEYTLLKDFAIENRKKANGGRKHTMGLS